DPLSVPREVRRRLALLAHRSRELLGELPRTRCRAIDLGDPLGLLLDRAGGLHGLAPDLDHRPRELLARRGLLTDRGEHPPHRRRDLLRLLAAAGERSGLLRRRRG